MRAVCIPRAAAPRGDRHGRYVRHGVRRRHATRRRQGGAVLLATLALTIVAGAGVLLARFDDAAAVRARQDDATARALADARRALIGWSVGAGLARSGEAHAPGVLPYPDRNTDPNGYDGEADCVTSGLSDRHLIGRLPRAGEASPCPDRALGVELRDGSGEPLWYAVSRNLVNHRGGGVSDPPINPGLLDRPPAYPWLRLIDANGGVVTASDGEPLEIAAVIIAPGPPLPGPDAGRARARPCPLPGLGHRERRDLRQRGLRRLPGRGRRRERAHGLPRARRRGVHPASGLRRYRDRDGLVQRPHRLDHGRGAAARGRGACAGRDGGGPGTVPVPPLRVSVARSYAGDPGADPTRTVLYHATADGSGGTRHGMLPIHAMPGQLYDTEYVLRWTIDSGAAVSTTDPSSIGAIPRRPMPSSMRLCPQSRRP